MTLNEVAPPTKKHEKMVKHIKKTYKKDGKLTDDEKSIAYATAWKDYNKDKVSEGVLADRLKKIAKEKKETWDKEGNKAKKDAYKALDDVKKTQDELDKSLSDDYKPLPREKMNRQYVKKREKNQRLYDTNKEHTSKTSTRIDRHGNSNQTRRMGGILREPQSADWQRTQSRFKSKKNTEAHRRVFKALHPHLSEGILDRLKPKKKENKKPEIPTGAEAKIRKWRKDKKQSEHEKYVNFLPVDENKTWNQFKKHI